MRVWVEVPFIIELFVWGTGGMSDIPPLPYQGWWRLVSPMDAHDTTLPFEVGARSCGNPGLSMYTHGQKVKGGKEEAEMWCHWVV